MKEYIERASVHSIIEQTSTLMFTRGKMHEQVDSLPAADVAEVRHGRWILEREPDGTPYCFHCSVCDNDFHHIGIMTATDYCPNCGARMDKEDEHEQ